MNYAKRWTNNELAIVLYFSSRRIRSESVSLLLHRRGYNRTPIAAERKVDKIVSDCPSLRLFVEDSWDIDVVDRWPDDLLGDSEKVNCLISFTPEDAARIQNQNIDEALWSARESEIHRRRMQEVIPVPFSPIRIMIGNDLQISAGDALIVLDTIRR